MTTSIRLAITLACVLLAGCLGMPDRVQPVQGFDVDRYLGHRRIQDAR